MKKLIALTLVGMMALTPITAFADETDDRITALEEKVVDLEERIAALEGSSKADTSGHADTAKTTDASEASVGTGEFYISGRSGSTENGDKIIFYVNQDHERDISTLGIKTIGLDGSILTYFYVDDTLNTKEQVSGHMSMIMLMLQGAALDEGVHTVKAVQYADNDESGEILFEKAEQYEVIYK